MSLEQSYRQLTTKAAVLELGHRSLLRIGGEDARRFLHAMCTNHVEQLQPGEGTYAFFLDAQGHILADAHILCTGESSFLLDTEPGQNEFLKTHLDRYIVMDDVIIEDVTTQSYTTAVEGPAASELLANFPIDLPDKPFSHSSYEGVVVLRASYTGLPGYWFIAPLDEAETLKQKLTAQVEAIASWDSAELVRIELAKPKFGVDFGPKNLPQETQLLYAIHFQKGCYIGQEIVERVRSRGHVNRLLVPIEGEGDQAFPSGVPIQHRDQRVGEITSSAYSPGLQKPVGLAYLRREFVNASELEACGRPVRIRRQAIYSPYGDTT